MEMNEGSRVMHLYHKSCHLYYSGIGLIYVGKHVSVRGLVCRHVAICDDLLSLC